MKQRYKNIVLDYNFYCCKCGSKGIGIARQRKQLREAGHLKKLWCIKCQKEVNHAECKESGKYNYLDFMIEFTHNNFNETQNRKQPYSLLKENLKKQGVDINAEKESFNNDVWSARTW